MGYNIAPYRNYSRSCEAVWCVFLYRGVLQFTCIYAGSSTMEPKCSSVQIVLCLVIHVSKYMFIIIPVHSIEVMCIVQ